MQPSQFYFKKTAAAAVWSLLWNCERVRHPLMAPCMWMHECTMQQFLLKVTLIYDCY